MVERYADDQIPKSAWESERDVLTNHFWDVRESDAGEITAAKEAVLAAFDPNPFCSAVAACSAITTSVFCEADGDDEVEKEGTRQAGLLRSLIAGSSGHGG